jgi:phosphoenolpyruvate synthase/pyruvate phosphate dikinase
MDYLVSLNSRRIPKSIGNKAINLRRLAEIGLHIPGTHVVVWDAYRRYMDDDIKLVSELQNELARKLDPGAVYAVRSSANIEDSFEQSFAGQFKSVLNMRGIDNIFQAVWSVWATTTSQNVQSYLEKHGINSHGLFMGVIIQQMIQPVFAGVALSRNPVTGADEVVVEAVQGSGEALVQTGVTPYRWINKWGTYIQKPENELLPPSLIDQVVKETRIVAEKLKSHVDLEWVYDGTDLYWLQVREITTLNRHNVYSNHLAKEMLPGMVKPLIGSVNIPLVCSMWVRLVTEMVGNTGIKPEDLAKPFYYRVYFNMGTLGRIFQEIGMPADSVETLMGVTPPGATKPSMKPTPKTLLRLPNLALFFLDKWFFEKKMRKALEQIQGQFTAIDYRRASQLNASQLLEETDKLFNIVQNAAYYNIVGPLLMMMYNRVLQNQLKKIGVDFSQLDLVAELPDLNDYDPNFFLFTLHEKFLSLEPNTRETILRSSYADFLKLPGINTFQQEVNSFLERFGHFSDSGNDFSARPWRESPEVVLGLITNFMGTSIHPKGKVKFSELNIKGSQRRKLTFFIRRALRFRLLREQISSTYTYGYGLFRYYYLALGEHMVRQGLLDEAQDIFFLHAEEVRQLVTGQHPDMDARKIVSNHKEDMQRFENITLPSVIYGDDPPPIEDPTLNKLIGVPTSIGHYTGPVTVVRGIMDFNKVRQGDVLVIPYSDVGWAPLFARAGAVVAESGGLLSHSSIVAREYNIPAVVSVEGATQLRDQTLVTVNGHNGEVLVHNNHKE